MASNRRVTAMHHPLSRRILHRSAKPFAPFLCFLAAAAACWAGSAAAPHIQNFGEVNETLFRGAEPSPAGLQDLQGRGVKLIIDLRESGQATVREQQLAKQLGMEYVNVPFPPFSAPTAEEVRTVLFLMLNHGNEPVFVHCRRGKDRTGTVMACYRVQHDGWTNARALTEADQYGMSHLERSMRAYILHFSALTNAAQPALFPPHATR